jgi:hypothetical protein
VCKQRQPVPQSTEAQVGSGDWDGMGRFVPIDYDFDKAAAEFEQVEGFV